MWSNTVGLHPAWGRPPFVDGRWREWAVWLTVLALGGLAQGIDRCPRSNTCANGKCYDNSQQCNNQNDCGDGSDEWDCNDDLNKLNSSANKGFVWPWWILGLTSAVVILTCIAVICRYVNERTDPSLDAYLLEVPSPRPRRSRHRSRTRGHERERVVDQQENQNGIELARTTDRGNKDTAILNEAESQDDVPVTDPVRERPKVKKLPPPIPPPPHLAARGADGGNANTQHTVDIEPLPPPPPIQPTRAAPPVPILQQTGPPPVAPKPRMAKTPAATSTTATLRPPTSWETTMSAPLDGSVDSVELPPPYDELDVDGYHTLQVDQRSAMARGEE